MTGGQGFLTVNRQVGPREGESKKEMEESFEVRVKRLFGSQLFESVPRSSFPASSWSVADGDVERKEWNRERGAGSDRSDDPCSSAFVQGGCFAKKRSAWRSLKEDFGSDMDDLDGDSDGEGLRTVDEEEDEEKDEGGDRDAEASEMRSFVGLDPTLDNEDEEDEFDRAALGKDDVGERLYMRDVKNRGSHLNYHNIFIDVEEEPYGAGSHHFYKDPRADHLAAGTRLEEDEKAAENFSVSNYSKAEQPFTTVMLEVTVDDSKLKPILKRKVANIDSKPKKRVRFDAGCKGDNDAMLKGAHDFAMFSHSMEAPTASDPNTVMIEKSGIPDYMRNPSKYTHYTYDSYENDDLAFEGDFHNSIIKLNPEELHQHVTIDLPKTITFNPRRKSIDAMPVDNESGVVESNDVRKEFIENDVWVTRTVGIAAGESYEAGVCNMEEDFLETPISDEGVETSRTGRVYRTRAISDD